MRAIFRVFALCLCALLLFSCSCNLITPEEKDPEVRSENYFEYFDTVCSVLSYAGDEEEVFLQNAALVKSELSRYHKLFDIYFGYSGVTNVYTLNKKAKVAPVVVDETLFDFLVYAKEMYTLTEGKVNVAMGAVLSIWHDARESVEDDPMTFQMPTDETLREANTHTNIDDLILNADDKTVYFSDPELKLDVGALAKGYATEKIGEMLEERGVTSYVLNFGGNIRAIGTRPSGAPWVTGITNPDKTSSEAFVARINLSDTSLVTSGDYERYFVYEGERYHHIIDPLTLYPTKYARSVSILTADSGLADALSTALFCMSYEDGVRLLDTLKEKGHTVDVLWVFASGDVKMTDGFARVVLEE